MSILTGNEIKKELERGLIQIDPFNPKNIGPNSIDLTLADDLIRYTEFPLEMRKENPTEPFFLDKNRGGWLLEPNTLYLGRTIERIGSDQYVPLIEGRSSVGRLGIQVHATAGVGDLGFFGTITLEIMVTHPVWVYPKERVAQALFFSSKGDITPYSGRYQGQTLATASRFHLGNLK